MAAPVTPNVGPINRVMMGAAAALGLAWSFAPSSSSDVTGLALSGACAVAGAAMLVTGSGRVLRDYRIRKLIALSKEVSDDHGSAREATRSELTAADMDEETDLLGLANDGQPVWRPRHLPFSLIEMPPGGGKSVSYVIPWIISRADAGYSLIIADPKCELYPARAEPEGTRHRGLGLSSGRQQGRCDRSGRAQSPSGADRRHP